MSDNGKGFTYCWVIENFSMLPHQIGELLKSDMFVLDQWPDVKWHYSLYPRGKVEYPDGIALYLNKDAKEQKLNVTYSVTILSTDPSTNIYSLIENQEIETGYGWPYFTILSDIYAKKELYLPNDTLTVRCCLRPADEMAEETIILKRLKSIPNFTMSCQSRTSIQVHRRSFTMPVQVTEELSKSDNTSFIIETPLTKYPDLKITLNFTDLSEDDFVKIEIRQTSLPIERAFIKCKMTVISSHEKYQDSIESTHYYELSLEDVWHFSEFLLASNLTSDKYLYLDDTTLLLQCEFAFSFKSTVYHLESNHAPLTFEAKNDRRGSKLIRNLEKLYLDRTFCDVDLRAVGDKTFPAHKIVLCAMSPVFRAMFENDMKEKDSNVVEIEDVDPDTLKRMLDFMHSDALKEDLSFESACKLFSAADKYDVVTLKRKCSLLLVSSLSVANVCDVLVLADAHQDNFLLTVVRNYIFNHANGMFYSDDWKKFMGDNPKLSGEIMLQVLTKK